MLRNGKVGLVASIALAVVLASGANASAALLSATLRTSVVTVTDNVVNVVVVNSSTSTQTGTIAVSAVVNGVTVTNSATTTLGPLQSGVVAISLPAAPSRLLQCGVVLDGSNPI